MSKLIEKWKEINNSLQSLSDRVGVHWLIVLLGAITLIVGSTFGFGFWLWDISHPEPPVYVIKTRIQVSPPNIILPVDYGDKKFDYVYQLWDICGIRSYISLTSESSNIPEFRSNDVIIEMNQRNLTYSISFITKRKKGIIPLHIYSRETDFSIDTNKASVNEVGESRNVAGLFEKIINIDLSVRFGENEALFNIIPKIDGKINIKCIGIKNCQFGESLVHITRITSADFGRIHYKNYKNDTTIKEFVAIFPRLYPNKIMIYQLDVNTAKFDRINVDDPTIAKQIVTMNPPPPCSKDGKIYLKH